MTGSHNRTVPSSAGAGQQLAVGAERHPNTPYWCCWPEGRADGLAGDRVPQPHRAVVAGAGQQLAVRAERHSEHAVLDVAWALEAWSGAPTAWPVAGFHNRTVPSLPALASSLPSGLNATPDTTSWRSGLEGRADGLAGDRVPQPHRAVAVGAGQQLAIRAERHPRHAVLGAGGVEGRADGLAGGRVPQPHRAVAVGAGQQLAVRAERHPVHTALGAPVYNALGVEAWRGAPTAWPVTGFHNRTVPSPPALASSLPSGLNATPSRRTGVGGQDAILLLLGQQGCHGGAGLAGGEDAPGGDGEPPRGHGMGEVDGEAFGGELTG